MANTNIILYSTGCPKCNVLKTKLDSKGINYTVNDSIDEMTSLRIDAVPVLFVGDTRLEFKEAVEWVNNQ
jgi:glutaredoxin